MPFVNSTIFLIKQNKVVRNSWGNKWGAAGYVLVQRGVDLCMIEGYVRTANVI